MAYNDYSIINQFFEQEYRFSVPQEQLKDPTSDLVKHLYQILGQHVFNMDEKSYTKDVASVANQINAQHFDRSLSIVKTVNLMSLLCRDLNILPEDEGFNYGDIVYPKANRTRKIMSTLIRYVYFRQERAPDTRQVYDDLESREKDFDHQRFQVETMQRQIARLRQEFDSTRRKNSEKLRKCGELKQQVNELKIEAEKWKSECSKKVAAYVELEEKQKFLGDTLKALRERSSALDQNIVRSPDKLFKDIADLEEQRSKLRDDNARQLSSISELERELKSHELVEKNIEEFTEELTSLEKDWSEQLKIRREEDEQEKDVEKHQTDVQRLKDKMEAIESNLRAKKQELTLRKNELERQRDDSQEQKVQCETGAVQFAEMEQKLKEDKSALKHKIEAEQKKQETFWENYEKAFKKLTDTFNELMQSVLQRDEETKKVRRTAFSVMENL